MASLIERAFGQRAERTEERAAATSDARYPDAPIRADEKDRPLLLRRRSDGRLCLASDTFPSRHEFDKDWMLETPECELVDGEFVVLLLANATAVYRVRHDLMRVQVPNDGGKLVEHRLASGYWGELVEEHYEEVSA